MPGGPGDMCGGGWPCGLRGRVHVKGEAQRHSCFRPFPFPEQSKAKPDLERAVERGVGGLPPRAGGRPGTARRPWRRPHGVPWGPRRQAGRAGARALRRRQRHRQAVGAHHHDVGRRACARPHHTHATTITPGTELGHPGEVVLAPTFSPRAAHRATSRCGDGLRQRRPLTCARRGAVAQVHGVHGRLHGVVRRRALLLRVHHVPGRRRRVVARVQHAGRRHARRPVRGRPGGPGGPAVRRRGIPRRPCGVVLLRVGVLLRRVASSWHGRRAGRRQRRGGGAGVPLLLVLHLRL